MPPDSKGLQRSDLEHYILIQASFSAALAQCVCGVGGVAGGVAGTAAGGQTVQQTTGSGATVGTTSEQGGTTTGTATGTGTTGGLQNVDVSSLLAQLQTTGK